MSSTGGKGISGLPGPASDRCASSLMLRGGGGGTRAVVGLVSVVMALTFVYPDIRV